MNNQFYTMYPYMNSVPTRAIGAFGPASVAPVRSGGLLSSLFGSRAVAPTLATGAKTFSFTNLLNGASKTLGVINQAIPVVYQIKPIWNNAKTMFRVAKELGKAPDKDTTKVENNSNNKVSNSSDTSNSNSSSPQFFI